MSVFFCLLLTSLRSFRFERLVFSCRAAPQALKLTIPTNDSAPWVLRDKSAQTKNKIRLLLTGMADS
eukprot:10956393-Alexandrium_andersonii.AAC.1